MGSIDEARAAAAAFRHLAGERMGALHGVEQALTEAEREFRGRLGSTSHPRVAETEARCAKARKDITEAIAALASARDAAEQFSADFA